MLRTHSTVLFVPQLGVCVASRGRGGVRVCVRVPQPVQSSQKSISLGRVRVRSEAGLAGSGAGWLVPNLSLSHDAGAGSIDEQGGSEAAAAAAARAAAAGSCACGCAARAAVRPGPQTEPKTARDNLKQRTCYTTGNTISRGRIYECTRM